MPFEVGDLVIGLGALIVVGLSGSGVGVALAGLSISAVARGVDVAPAAAGARSTPLPDSPSGASGVRSAPQPDSVAPTDAWGVARADHGDERSRP